ncbi:MAG: LOG family protein [Sulfolobus sp.]|nr:LOG family protein [Sulfolobus sp.]
MPHINIGIAASSSYENKDIAYRFVNSLPFNVNIILGGYWGLMKNVADAAAERGLRVIFIMPENAKVYPEPRDEFIIINTGLEYRARSVTLCKSSDVLVSLGGEAGTIIEIIMGYAMGIPVVVLKGTGLPTDNLEKAFNDYVDRRKTSKITYVDSPEKAALIAIKQGYLKALKGVEFPIYG